jgi:hypothetical protein
MARFASLVRHFGIASLAGMISGFVVAGILGRIAMRVAGFTARPDLIGVATSNGNRVGEITVAGTVALAVFVGLFAGIAGGVFYAAAEPWLRSTRWKGVIFGGGLLLALGFTFIDPGNFDFERFGSAPLNVAMFAALFVAFGAATAYLYDVIRRVTMRSGPISRGVEALTWLAALAGALAAITGIFSVGGLSLSDLPLVLPFAVAAIVPPVVLWRHLPRYVGYAGFAIPVVVGGVRTLSGVLQLID